MSSTLLKHPEPERDSSDTCDEIDRTFPSLTVLHVHIFWVFIFGENFVKILVYKLTNKKFDFNV